MSNFAQKINAARAAGRAAAIAGHSVESNPYTNRAGGREYYRAWRSGWYSYQP